MKSVLATIAFAAGASAYVTGVNPYKPPHQSEGGQYGCELLSHAAPQARQELVLIGMREHRQRLRHQG